MRHLHTEQHYPHTEVYAEQDAPLSMIRLAYKLVDLLPHGSGIDGTWHVTAYENRVECCNSLHAMDEFGGYAGWYDFTVEFDTDDIDRIKTDPYYVQTCVDWDVYEELYPSIDEEINPWNYEEEEEGEI